jgi:hypothetical protein
MTEPTQTLLQDRAQALHRCWQERERLKRTGTPGIVDWGAGRRPECRYEAYWRGMSIGLFPSADAAQVFLQGLGPSPGRTTFAPGGL